MAKERNYGIDLLRIVSMAFVPVLHVLGYGGVLETCRPQSLGYAIAWLLEVAVYCAVDCFALITGYVGYGSSHKYKGFLSLCLQLLFYTVGVTAVFLVVDPSSVGASELLHAIIPFRGTYWYVTAYLCLFLVMPWLDIAVGAMDERALQRLLVVLFVGLSVVPTLLVADMPRLEGGYSFVWLAAMYVVGSAIRRLRLGEGTSHKRCVLVYVACVLVSWVTKLAVEQITAAFFGAPYAVWQLVSYTSPTIVGCAVALLLLFSRLELRTGVTRFVRFFSPLCFGVYLLHVEPLVWMHAVKGAFVWIASLNPLVIPPAVIACAAGIWLVGVLVDWVRVRLFTMLRVDALCVHVGEWLDERLLPTYELAEH